jgi:hypothetical protein
MAENPYTSPNTLGLSRRIPSRPTPVGFILVLLATLPAAGIACFTICLGVVSSSDAGGTEQAVANGLISGAIAAVVVLGLMLWWAISLNRASREPMRAWRDVDGKTLEATLVWWDENEALLRKRDGKEVKVLIERLCDADRASLKERE